MGEGWGGGGGGCERLIEVDRVQPRPLRVVAQAAQHLSHLPPLRSYSTSVATTCAAIMKHWWWRMAWRVNATMGCTGSRGGGRPARRAAVRCALRARLCVGERRRGERRRGGLGGGGRCRGAGGAGTRRWCGTRRCSSRCRSG